MEGRKILAILVLTLSLILCQAKVSEAGPMGTAFTYQGHLYDANSAANGLYDFQFKLFDDPNVILGNQVGSDVNIADEDVIDALFTVELDFGSSVFDGNAVWLEIGVRPGEMNDPNVYTTLSPRQEVTPTPYAIYAKTAGGDNDWMISGNDMYSIPSGNVGIGTTNPSSNLEIGGNTFGIGNAWRWDVLNGPEDGHNTLNIRATGVNKKALFRLMPKGGGASITGDRSEFTLMGVDVDQVNRWWADFKVRERTTDNMRYLHFLTDREGLSEPITRVTFEIDGENESQNTEYFSIVRNSWIDEAENDPTKFMIRIQGGIGITEIEQNTIRLNSGNLVLAGGSGYDVVTDNTLRPFTDNVFTLGVTTFRWNSLVVGTGTSSFAGNVGIGTTSPAGKLDVNGSIYQRGGVLHADYVFEQDYELESIDKHSEFMWQHKHLAAIPKAKVDENGQEIIEVGAHRKGIVEELEKAHIYIEQLHKQNKALETRLVKLEAIVARLNVSQKGGIE